MNMLVSTAAVAAAPAAAVSVPAMAGPILCEPNSTEAELARLEQALGVLRTRAVCEGWTLDEAGADHALSYFRDGCPDDDARWGRTIKFIGSHGLSFDWILFGDPSTMIAGLAASSARAKTLAAKTDPIFAEIEAHRRASSDYSAAIRDMVPGTLDPDPVKEETAGNREAEARHDLATSVPTTLGGLLAVLNYVEEVSNGKCSESGRPDNAFDREDLMNVLIGAQDCVRTICQRLA